MTPDASLPPANYHTCFAGPILEDRCAICGRIFVTDASLPPAGVQRPHGRDAETIIADYLDGFAGGDAGLERRRYSAKVLVNWLGDEGWTITATGSADVQRPDDEAWCRCGHEWTDHQVPRAGSNFSTWCNICGTDCADVRPPTPPLTNEELAELMWKVDESSIVRRLIADLRASRERIKELEAEVEEWKQAHRSEVGY